MSRARRQLDIGRWVGEYPIAQLRDLVVTIADWRQCNRPEIGELAYVVLDLKRIEGQSYPGGYVGYQNLLGRGYKLTFGKYASARERRALLNGKRIEDGKH